jgi:uncharacterized protein involved in type VI secretion and phage assembly
MATTYAQATRAMEVITTLGPNTLLLAGLSGQEGISRLFQFQLDLHAENAKEVPFDKLLGQKILVSMAPWGRSTRR